MARELSFRFPLPLGLHARPASALREVASAFTSAITLTNRRTGREANAKSVLALVATLTRQGDECTMRIAGSDEPTALERVERFIAAELPLCDEEAAVEAPTPQADRRLPRALRGGGVVVHRGRAASGGIGRAPAFVVAPQSGPDAAGCEKGSPEEELAKLDRVLAQVGAALRGRRAGASDATDRAILEAHLAIIEDVELAARIADEVRATGSSAGQAVTAVAERFAALLRDSGSAVLAERALDVRDVAALLIRALYPGIAAGDEPIVLVRSAVVLAENLSPAQLLALDTSRLAGIVLGAGGTTSHTVILARAHGVPCVAGVGAALHAINDGQDVIVDGERGLVVVGPPPDVLAFYEAESATLRAIGRRLDLAAGQPAVTSDGRRIEVAANVSSLAEVQRAFAAGAEGIGLFRTELLFMDRAQAPSEDEQAAVYAEAARIAGGRRLIIRTLDVGGDKPIPYLPLGEERNPFLGFRAIRAYPAVAEVVSAQVRAILRASAHGNVRIMFPMVGSPAQARALRGLVAAEMAKLDAEGVPFDRGIEVGVMVEVPSLAFVMEETAREAGFFSIGSNDLLQYLLAVERGNERVAHLYNPFEPAFLRALAAICEGARAAGRWIGLCGELGGDPLAAPLLVGLGLDEISVSSATMAAVKSAIARCSVTECRALLQAALRQDTAAEVEALLRTFAAGKADRALLAEDLVRLGSTSHSKDEAIRELIGMLRIAGRVADPDPVEDAIWQREDTYSTGVGFGIAIPHCKSEGVRATSIAVASYPDGIEWQSLDGSPVTMAILIAVSAADPGDTHLRTIAALSRRLMDDEFRAALLAAGDAADVVALLQGVVDARSADDP